MLDPLVENRKVTLGWHWFIDLTDCQRMPVKASSLEYTMLRAAEVAGATVVQRCFHEFSPIGLTGVLVIAESHFAVHTWPEHKAICVDIFSCTEKIKVESAVAFLKQEFAADHVNVRMQSRHCS